MTAGGEDGEELPVLATFAVLCATAIVFAAELHVLMIKALADSYRWAPLQGGFEAGNGASGVLGAVSAAAAMSLNMAAPFIVLAIVANAAIGILNRIVQQVPVYFVSVPVMLLAGLGLLWLALAPMMERLAEALREELIR